MSLLLHTPNENGHTVGELLVLLEQIANDLLAVDPNDPAAQDLLQAVATTRSKTPAGANEIAQIGGFVNAAHAIASKPGAAALELDAATVELERDCV